MRAIEGPPGDAMTAVASVFRRRQRRDRSGSAGLGFAAIVVVSAVWLFAWLGRATAQGDNAAPAAQHDAQPAAQPAQQDDQPAQPDDQPDDQFPPAAEDAGVFLPSDRAKERQLDRGSRLLAAGEWTDAVALLDEILAADRDAFMVAGAGDGTRLSIRSEATRLVGALPPAGRDAYALLFRSRAERALAEAVARAAAKSWKA